MDDAYPPGSAHSPAQSGARSRSALSAALLVNTGWFGTGLALLVSDLPLKYLLKDELHLSAAALALFTALANVPIYIKPFAGILSDAVPLFGTRRRSYLLLSLLLGGLFWVLLALVPRTLSWLLWTYVALNVFLTLTSTVLGGLMVEVGQRERMTGRLSAQRLGITRVVGLIAGPLSGYLARQAFVLTGAVCGALHLLLVPLYYFFLKEPRDARPDAQPLREVARQTRTLVRSGTLWAAAGLVVLVVASPGFDTPLFYLQTNTFGFSPEFIGWLALIKAAFSVVGAVLYGMACRRMNLRPLLAASIVVHAVMTLWYLLYGTPLSAAVITAVEAATMALALLPLYDLAARATPRGSEALGYSLMMSVWNFTGAMSNITGAWLYDHWSLGFTGLVWVNAGTTALVLLAVPFLPKALMDRRDGD